MGSGNIVPLQSRSTDVNLSVFITSTLSLLLMIMIFCSSVIGHHFGHILDPSQSVNSEGNYFDLVAVLKVNLFSLLVVLVFCFGAFVLNYMLLRSIFRSVISAGIIQLFSVLVETRFFCWTGFEQGMFDSDQVFRNQNDYIEFFRLAFSISVAVCLASLILSMILKLIKFMMTDV
jgi:hypothetical protein